MSVPLDLLYRVGINDTRGAIWAPFSQRQSTSSAATAVATPAITPPDGYIAFLTNVYAASIPDSTQVAQDIGIGFSLASTLLIPQQLLMANSLPGTAAGETAEVMGSIDYVIVPGGRSLYALGNFDAGLAANSVVLDVHGYIVPKANVSLF